jgi:GTP-binding protein HflX
LTPVEKQNLSIDDMKITSIALLNGSSLFISATEKQNIDELRNVLMNKVKQIHFQRYPNKISNPA